MELEQNEKILNHKQTEFQKYRPEQEFHQTDCRLLQCRPARAPDYPDQRGGILLLFLRRNDRDMHHAVYQIQHPRH